MRDTDSIPTQRATGAHESLQRYALLGHNIAYSASPALYIPWFERHHINATFEIIDTPCVTLEFLLTLSQNYRGLCITTPYKKQVYEFLQRSPEAVTFDETSVETQAVNVLMFENNKVVAARNTDALALHMLLAQHAFGASYTQLRCVVFGSGGAANASVWALRQLNVAHIFYQWWELGPGY